MWIDLILYLILFLINIYILLTSRLHPFTHHLSPIKLIKISLSEGGVRIDKRFTADLELRTADRIMSFVGRTHLTSHFWLVRQEMSESFSQGLLNGSRAHCLLLHSQKVAVFVPASERLFGIVEHIIASLLNGGDSVSLVILVSEVVMMIDAHPFRIVLTGATE